VPCGDDPGVHAEASAAFADAAFDGVCVSQIGKDQQGFPTSTAPRSCRGCGTGRRGVVDAVLGPGEAVRSALVVIDMINTYDHKDSELLTPTAERVVPVPTDLNGAASRRRGRSHQPGAGHPHAQWAAPGRRTAVLRLGLGRQLVHPAPQVA
jgi:hypothetical protein